LRFKGADVGHSPRCPKGRVHEGSVGNGIFGILTFVLIQCDPLWLWIAPLRVEGRVVPTILKPASLLTPHARSTSARVAFWRTFGGQVKAEHGRFDHALTKFQELFLRLKRQ
jgi:hypothetical protein